MLREIECVDLNNPFLKSIEFYDGDTVFGYLNYSLVYDRIEIIKDKPTTKSPDFRPEYIYQIPLTFIPGLGGKTIEKLLDAFDTEMNILHKLSYDDIEAVVGTKLADNIEAARTGKMKINAGGGGVYGKVVKE